MDEYAKGTSDIETVTEAFQSAIDWALDHGVYDFTAGPHHEINEDLCPVTGSNQDIVPCVDVTPAQERAMVRLHGEWAVVNEPKLYPCVPGPVVVDVVGDSGVGMSLVVETDGYVHS